MPTFKIILAYDGTPFVGWQRQASGTSVQGLLEDALRELDERDVAVTGAGRTDAGVHALGQVAGFSLERAIAPDALVRAINARLPGAVRVLSAVEASPTFHARFEARTKIYCYRIWNGDVMSPFERAYAWHVPGSIALEPMRAAARVLEGRHDFAAFQAAGSETLTTTRVVFSSRIVAGLKPCATAVDQRGAGLPPSHEASASAEASADSSVAFGEAESANRRSLAGATSAAAALGWLGGDGQTCAGRLIVYEIAGSGFLRHMVRNIVGTLVEIGCGRRPVEWVSEVLASRDRARAGRTAPPEGLVLVAVEYASQVGAM